MQVAMELPTTVEGNWKLVDKDGKTVATQQQYPNAQLVIEPYFYRGQYAQTLSRVCIQGKKGRVVKQSVRISASAGRLAAEMTDKVPAPIVPRFDVKTSEDNDDGDENA